MSWKTKYSQKIQNYFCERFAKWYVSCYSITSQIEITTPKVEKFLDPLSQTHDRDPVTKQISLLNFSGFHQKKIECIIEKPTTKLLRKR